MVYESLPFWRLEQVRDLRVLFRYAAGMRSTRTAVRNWHDLCARLEKAPPADDKERKQREAAYTDQLNNFKEGSNSLDFAEGVVCPKLDHVREELYEFYRRHPDAKHDMTEAYKTVYLKDALGVGDIKLWLANVFQATPGPRAVNRLPGVYLLYRHGMFVDGQPTVVRSAMLIVRGSMDGKPFLTFDIKYPLTNEDDSNATETISGIILATLGHYIFFGADSGAAKSPYQLTAKMHAQDAAPGELSGLLIRHSHGNEVVASRILIVRYSNDTTGAAPESEYRKQFEHAKTMASVLRPTDMGTDALLTERRQAKFTNAIDSVKAPLLWLTADRQSPEAPVLAPAKR